MRTPRNPFLIALAFVALGVAPRAAAYDTCAISSPTLAFGAYDPTSASARTASISFTVSCIKRAGDANQTYRVLASVGSGTFTTRTMSNGTDALNWNLYSDAAMTVIWGDGTAPSVLISGSMPFAAAANNTTVTQTHTVYGSIPAGQDLSVGNYLPTTITTTFRTQGGGPPTVLATGTLGVTTNIAAICAVSANSTMAFGTYDPLSATPLDATATITFKCAKGGTFDIGIGGTVGSRTMSSGVDTLGFELYRDSGRTLAWGNTQDSNTLDTDASGFTTGAGSTTAAASRSATVYGRIAAGQDKTPGSYTATLTITIYY